MDTAQYAARALLNDLFSAYFDYRFVHRSYRFRVYENRLKLDELLLTSHTATREWLVGIWQTEFDRAKADFEREHARMLPIDELHWFPLMETELEEEV